MNIFSKMFKGLKKTKDNFSNLISGIFTSELNDEFFEELEFALISSDMGALAVEDIISNLKVVAKKNKIKNKTDFQVELKKLLVEILKSSVNDNDEVLQPPFLLMFTGVNGVGKTTAIGKLAHYYKNKGNKVLVVAADTFRAAASDQLTEWATRAGVRIVKYAEGADPGAVVYDGVASAIAKRDDVVLVDTAGRLHTKDNLMEELKKIKKVILKEWQDRPLKNYLVIDATTGQNALAQVEVFNNSIGVDGIILTKLDGTAKGGIVFAIAKKYNIPVKFVGVGESIDDIIEFSIEEFVEGLL